MRLGSNQNTSVDGFFMCGVVEGFYGRPWSQGQRIELFKRMRDMGMNTYLYAPKDDLKHRQYWRELYSVEEADHMQILVRAAEEAGTTFIYAISPGLDMTFSNAKEVACLKRKIDQVIQLGCTSFALLFDDINPELSPADKEVYQSFGHAQTCLTNEIYQHVSVRPPLFLFCPTEYCATRAVPSVSKSEYLNTIGSKLLPGIDIMWTGPKVISKHIPVDSIIELTSVLRRAPVIWDNIHANDYDQKRLFLGPYSGRNTALIPRLRGVLTNPNCEFESNYVAMHTLAQWSKSNTDSVRPNAALSTSPVRSDIKLEREGDMDLQTAGEHSQPGGNGRPTTLDSYSEDLNYLSTRALNNALIDWLKIMNQDNKVVPSRRRLRNRKSVAKALMAAAAGSLPPADAVAVCSSVTGTEALTDSEAIRLDSLLAEDNPAALAVAAVVAAVTVEEAKGKEDAIPPAALQNLDSCIGSGVSIAVSKLNPCLSLTLPPVHPAASPLAPLATFDNFITPAVADCIGAGGKNRGTPTPMDTELYDDQDEMQVDNQISGQGSMTDLVSVDMPQANDKTSQDPTVIGRVNSLHHYLPTSCHDDNSNTDGGVSPVGAIDDDESEYELDEEQDPIITVPDLALLVDLFYLPYEHGPQACRMLELVHWLRCNAHYVSESGQEGSPTKEVFHWREKAQEFHMEVERVKTLCNKLNRLPNRSLLCDLYPYIMDMRSVLTMLNSYCKWLANGQVPYLSVCYLRRLLTWCTPGYKEMFTSDDHEPWMFRGGLVAEFQRMLPLEGAQDMFPTKPFVYPPLSENTAANTSISVNDPAASNISLGLTSTSAANLAAPSAAGQSVIPIFLIRPYREGDHDALYNLNRRIVLERAIASGWILPGDDDLFLDSTKYAGDLPADRYIGCFLQNSPEYCFVLEDANGELLGYALSALDRSKFTTVQYTKHKPSMRLKYGITSSSEQPSTWVPETTGAVEPRVVFGMEAGDEEDDTPYSQQAEANARARCNLFVQRLLDNFLLNTNPEPSTAPVVINPLPSEGPQSAGQPQTSPSLPPTPGVLDTSQDVASSSLSVDGNCFPSSVHVDLLKTSESIKDVDVLDDITRRLFACLFAALKTNGSQGVQCEFDRFDSSTFEFYKKFGFQELPYIAGLHQSHPLFMGRTI